MPKSIMVRVYQRWVRPPSMPTRDPEIEQENRRRLRKVIGLPGLQVNGVRVANGRVFVTLSIPDQPTPFEPFPQEKRRARR